MRIDLHCHSTYSDGTMTPIELLDEARREGIGGLAITDHDSVESFYSLAAHHKEYGVQIIPGIEVSCEYAGESVHVLGYAYDPDTETLREFCRVHRRRRLERNREILKKLAQRGIMLDEADVQDASRDDKTFGRPHIAMALVRKGYVENVQEAFRAYLGTGRPCFVPATPWAPEEAIGAIHAAQGLAVIAHPQLIRRGKVLRQLCRLPFDGIEAFYSRLGAKAAEKWVKVAEKLGWFVTGGSDFHGAIRPEIRLGCSETSEAVFLRLLEHFRTAAPRYRD